MKNQLNKTNLIAVYGTLKRKEGNFGSMKRAEGVFVKEDYVEFEAVSGSGFPVAKFAEGTNKYLKIEIFEVPEAGVLGPLDSLEGYPSFYNRKEVTTLSGETVIIYEIVRSMQDNSDSFLTKEEDGKKYYTWK